MSTACRLLVLAWLSLAVAQAGEPFADGLLHLSTDKPIYRPGETVHLRGFALTQLDHRPLDGVRPVQVTLVSPRGERFPGGRDARLDRCARRGHALSDHRQPGRGQCTQVRTGRWPERLRQHGARQAAPDGRLETTLSRTRLPVGEPLECTVTPSNASAGELRSPLAVIPLPGGVEPDPEQLRGLARDGRIAFSEVRGGAVVLYFATFAANETRVVPLALVATVPGTYSGPAARAYGYYHDERKWWCAPLTVEIDVRR